MMIYQQAMARLAMDFVSREREWVERASRFLKAELKRAGVTYEELAGRLREDHGLDGDEAFGSRQDRSRNVSGNVLLRRDDGNRARTGQHLGRIEGCPNG